MRYAESCGLAKMLHLEMLYSLELRIVEIVLKERTMFMGKRLVWKKLLSEERQRMDSGKNKINGARNEFEADYDRIVGSSSVRRLQDKAQVFPLQENDFVRTRLTHSVEVSALARSLGKAVGKEIENRKLEEDFTAEETDKLAALLQVAGLIHDLGNPPFGHYGETIIREWFKKWFETEYAEFEKVKANLKEQACLSNQQKNDFTYFDGNVQNLRIVTKLQTLNDQFGANFTYGTLSTIMKYPWSSESIKKKKDKFGFFCSEESIVKDIWYKTGLSEGTRHPATYLLEAADDIIYICDDIEDGVKKGYINWECEYEKLKKEFVESKYIDLFERIDSKKTDENMEDREKELAKARNFRNIVQVHLFMQAKNQFLESYDEIMEGKFEQEDILFVEKNFVKRLKGITARNCFGCKEVLELELVGDKVIKTLLDIFVPAILNSTQKEIEDTRTYAGKLYKIISPNFKYIACHDYSNGCHREFEVVPVYDKIHLVVDYISGMTDSYAVNLYKKLLGIELP